MFEEKQRGKKQERVVVFEEKQRGRKPEGGRGRGLAKRLFPF